MKKFNLLTKNIGILIVLFIPTYLTAHDQDSKNSQRIKSELFQEVLVYKNTRRTYSVFSPTSTSTESRPLLIGLHGYYGNGKEFAEKTANIIDDLTERGYVGIFPDGQSMSLKKPHITSFNDIDSQNSTGTDGPTCIYSSYDYGVYDNCPKSQHEDQCNWGSSCSDDEGFFRKLIEIAIEKWRIDPRRVYLTGFSQGAQTVQSLAWRMSDVISAVAPQSGFAANGFSKAPLSKMSFVQVWSPSDRTVDGTDRASEDGMIYESASETFSTWATAQNCETEASPYATSYDGKNGWECSEHRNCKNRSLVISCIWNGGHAWVNDPAHDVMFDVFERHFLTSMQEENR